jgi:hypothetical protein
VHVLPNSFSQVSIHTITNNTDGWMYLA